MFKGCEKLNHVEMLAIDADGFTQCGSWLSGVASTGTFVKNKDARWSNDAIVPAGWQIVTK